MITVYSIGFREVHHGDYFFWQHYATRAEREAALRAHSGAEYRSLDQSLSDEQAALLIAGTARHKPKADIETAGARTFAKAVELVLPGAGR